MDHDEFITHIQIFFQSTAECHQADESHGVGGKGGVGVGGGGAKERNVAYPYQHTCCHVTCQFLTRSLPTFFATLIVS